MSANIKARRSCCCGTVLKQKPGFRGNTFSHKRQLCAVWKILRGYEVEFGIGSRSLHTHGEISEESLPTALANNSSLLPFRVQYSKKFNPNLRKSLDNTSAFRIIAY